MTLKNYSLAESHATEANTHVLLSISMALSNIMVLALLPITCCHMHFKTEEETTLAIVASCLFFKV